MKKHYKIIILLIMIVMFAAGCSKTQELQINSKPQKINLLKGKLIISSDETKYVVNMTSSSQYVFYYKDGLITDFEVFIDEGTEDEAKANLSSYEVIYDDDEEVESITQEKNYIVINYKDGYIEKTYTTKFLTDIKELYKNK